MKVFSVLGVLRADNGLDFFFLKIVEAKSESEALKAGKEKIKAMPNGEAVEDFIVYEGSLG